MKYLEILFRYLTLLSISIILTSHIFIYYLQLFYTYLTYYFFSLFSIVSLDNLVITFFQTKHSFIIIEACVGIAAYLFFLIIFMTLPLNLLKSFEITIKCFIYFTLLNLLRILFLIFIQIIFGEKIFSYLHLLFYEFLTSLLAALLIIYYLKKNNISKVYPLYSDYKYLLKNLKYKLKK